MTVESQLVPSLREGVFMTKMIFFKKLKGRLAQKYPERDAADVSKLCGAIVNRVFGTPNTEEPFATFEAQNSLLIEDEMGRIGTEYADMRIPLTDALRIQFLCDHQEGVDSSSTLALAKSLNILLVDREAPLPDKFLNLVRRLGTSLGFLMPSTEPSRAQVN